MAWQEVARRGEIATRKVRIVAERRGEVAIATKTVRVVAGRGKEGRNCHMEGADCGRTEGK